MSPPIPPEAALAVAGGHQPSAPLFLACVSPPLRFLLPLARAWSKQAHALLQWQRDWGCELHGPYGLEMLSALAGELGWRTDARGDPLRFNNTEPNWPVGWARSVDFTLRPPGDPVRWVFAIRRLVLPSGTLPETALCERVLASARRALRRILMEHNDLGIAALEIRLSVPVATGTADSGFDALLDTVAAVGARMGARAYVLHAAARSPVTAQLGPLATACVLVPCGESTKSELVTPEAPLPKLLVVWGGAGAKAY